MIKVFTGPMFAAKSARLIDAYNEHNILNNVLCFKPAKDTRTLTTIKSRDRDQQIEAIVISDLSEIRQYITTGINTIIIDEIQFLTGDVQELLDLSLHNYLIYVAGLSLTSEQKPFGIMPQILAIADVIQIDTASCSDCHAPAQYSYYGHIKNDDILIGDGRYMALCRNCLLNKRGN